MPTTLVGWYCLPRVVAGAGWVVDAGIVARAGLVAGADKVATAEYWAATGEVFGTP